MMAWSLALLALGDLLIAFDQSRPVGFLGLLVESGCLALAAMTLWRYPAAGRATSKAATLDDLRVRVIASCAATGGFAFLGVTEEAWRLRLIWYAGFAVCARWMLSSYAAWKRRKTNIGRILGMSGLYNLIFGGVDPKAPERLLGDLDFGRYRDSWIEKDPDGLVVAVYTRNGGPYRGEQASAIEAMQNHPAYIEDTDDTFDETYACFRFRVPAEYVAELESVALERVDTSKRWRDAIRAIEDGHLTPSILAFGASLMEIIDSALSEQGPFVVVVRTGGDHKGDAEFSDVQTPTRSPAPEDA